MDDKKLNSKQMHLLKRILKKRGKDISGQTLEVNEGYSEDVELIQEIIDLLSDELSEEGFGEEKEPNNYGLQVDDLITFYSRILIKLR